jgi:thiosulfate sulfurtransferase
MTDFERISVAKAKQLLEEGNALALDIRAKEDYDKGHIKGAMHLDASSFQSLVNTVNHTTPLLVYCYHGISSQGIAAQLHQKGFNTVYSLDGGAEAWQSICNLVSATI